MVYHPLVKQYFDNVLHESIMGLSPKEIHAKLPVEFVTAHEIDPKFRVKIQAIIQKYIDSSISSTVNLPEDISVEAVGDLYMLAWSSGCKGLTVYREGSREGILKTFKDKDDSVPESPPIATKTIAVLSNGEDHLVCPSCGSHSFHKENGCEQCNACGYGKCSVA
jgi:ribonucleoside-diphosphate reductase alpha chain